MRHLGDITNLSGYDLPVVDVITGGSPCQDLSIAGNRAGLAGERSGLFLEQVRIVKEMREHDRRTTGRTGELVRPRYMVWENVPGAFSSNKGADFQAVLTQIVKIVEPDCADVPMPEKNKWPHSGCLYDELGRWSVAWRLHDAQFWGVPQRRKRIAIVADFGGLTAPEILFERKGLHGHFAPGAEEGEGASGSTKAGADTAISFLERAGCDGGGKGILIQSEKTGALSTFDNQRVYCLQGNGIDRADTAGCNGKGWREDQSYTLNTIDRPAVYDCKDETDLFAMQAIGQYKESQAASALKTRDYKDATDLVVCNMVRRLTPLEYERLQGFPDGWTDIGEWTDTNGKTHQTSDSARYKALGNSIALPYWKVLARRICAQYDRDVTMGSSFDGIGGFPLAFEKAGATPVWASEIEEFCIAVTKKRFPDTT